MIWQMGDGEASMAMRVAEDLIVWLVSESQDHVVRSIDPYRDTVLDLSSQRLWLLELERLKKRLWEEQWRRNESKMKLPREPATRNAILEQTCERDLARDERYLALSELVSFVALAAESNFLIRAIGD